jgi:hypothetical protein
LDGVMDVAVAATDDAADGPWALPEGWCWTKLGKVLSPISTTDPKRILGQQTFHYIDLSALEDGRVTNAQLIVGKDAPSRARQALAAAEVIQHIGARPRRSLKELAKQHGLPV